ncbi:Ca2+-dependent phosphoinositide-specific phospholipase C [Sphingomonas sp. Leaf4]|uniref:Ca2+-dependent phosphoinositide-specific phospholipase C n=1 Tax=Sphingomonas sp. Leaf4 TaxID=2876553 RepID=UPI001E4B3AAA|nr:Ca2+-dependent phosphoinositide-specific phospholipase C [Sphingomonas sp. Leaf4]
MLQQITLALLIAAASPSVEMPELGQMRLDQVQYVETHNSYHLAPDAELLAWLLRGSYADGEWTGPRLARAIDYSNLPLTTQLDRGIRAFELDVHDDPAGDRFVRPGYIQRLRAAGITPRQPWDSSGAMRRPGFKTIHKADYDPRSTCPVFADCLRAIGEWSRAHPGHVPLLLMIEVKRDRRSKCVGLCADGWRRLEGELVHGLGRERIFAPAGIGPTWPTIDALRGRVLVFLLDAEDSARSYRAAVGDHGLLFTGPRPGKGVPLADTGERWAILPRSDDPRIATARARGMLVYTRADAETEQARAGDTTTRDRALASGAQIVSTDYPVPDPRFSGYAVRFAGGRFVRCNPVTGGACRPVRAATLE